METSVKINRDAEETLRDFLRLLLEKEMSQAVLVPLRLPFGRGVMPTLVRDPALLSDAAPLAPVMPVSEATIVGSLTTGGGLAPLAAVLRPCQVRAFVELIKLQQASREAVLVISIDCPGTYDVNDYATLAEKTANAGLDLLSGLRQGAPAPHAGFSFRAACRMCEQPLPDQADVRIKIVGVPGDAELRIIGPDSFMSELGLQPMDNVGAVDGSAEQRLVEARIVERDRLLAEFHDRVRDLSGLIEEFSTCIRCLNCMTACPLCYCKECIFRTETFNHRPADYQRWVNRKGAVKLPADTLLFHLTRLNHMVVSCVGCGLCESACPNDLPVARVFRAVGRRVQGLFGYVPGRDLMEEIPIATFREDELE